MFVLDDCIVNKYDIASFVFKLDESHILGLNDTSMSMVGYRGRDEDRQRDDDDVEVEQVEDPMGHKPSTKKTRLMNYDKQEDIAIVPFFDECLS